jgi:hypothetical protein
MYGYIAITEQPPEQRLIDIDAFNLVHVYFNGLAIKEAMDKNHPTIRDSFP